MSCVGLLIRVSHWFDRRSPRCPGGSERGPASVAVVFGPAALSRLALTAAVWVPLVLAAVAYLAGLPFVAASAQAEVLIGVAAPMSGRYHARGMESQIGAELAAVALNERGGVLGQQVEVVAVDDGCDEEQAVAAAYGLVDRNVRLVVGHSCSGPAIAAAPIYEEARIIQISPSATNPQLTDSGWRYVFRVCGRDDQQGRLAGDLLAEHWGDDAIAILHDGSTYGAGLAAETRSRLHALGVAEVLYDSYTPEAVHFTGPVERLRAHDADVVYIGGRESEIALIMLQARREGLNISLVSGDALIGGDAWAIAGDAMDGALFTFSPDPTALPAAQAVIARLRASGPFEAAGYTLHAYAAVQAWAQAVEAAGSLRPAAVRSALQSQRFDTVIGTFGFDGKGDVVGIETYIWYEWHDGVFGPVD